MTRSGNATRHAHRPRGSTLQWRPSNHMRNSAALQRITAYCARRGKRNSDQRAMPQACCSLRDTDHVSTAWRVASVDPTTTSTNLPERRNSKFVGHVAGAFCVRESWQLYSIALLQAVVSNFVLRSSLDECVGLLQDNHTDLRTEL